jgi:hypothetical protein
MAGRPQGEGSIRDYSSWQGGRTGRKTLLHLPEDGSGSPLLTVYQGVQKGFR